MSPTYPLESLVDFAAVPADIFLTELYAIDVFAGIVKEAL